MRLIFEVQKPPKILCHFEPGGWSHGAKHLDRISMILRSVSHSKGGTTASVTGGYAAQNRQSCRHLRCGKLILTVEHQFGDLLKSLCLLHPNTRLCDATVGPALRCHVQRATSGRDIAATRTAWSDLTIPCTRVEMSSPASVLASEIQP